MIPANSPKTGTKRVRPVSGKTDFHTDSEGFGAWAIRQVTALAYALRPQRLRETAVVVPVTLWRTLKPGPAVPDETSLAGPDGFGGPVHDRSPAAVLAGMRNGFHIMGHAGPLKWWAPPERAVMLLGDVRIPKRFRRTLRNAGFTVTIDDVFDAVVLGCAQPRRRLHLTWLHPKTRALLSELHRRGDAHSVEVRNEAGELVGGVFGVAIGPVFSALSMFHTANDASKLAIVSLYHHMSVWGFAAVDHQALSPWVRDLGGREIPRAEFNQLIRSAGPSHAMPGRWHVEFTPKQTAEWQPSGAAEKSDEEPVRAAAAGG
jgi:leucyl/phenylalanyl-tRNA--protein transferase